MKKISTNAEIIKIRQYASLYYSNMQIYTGVASTRTPMGAGYVVHGGECHHGSAGASLLCSSPESVPLLSRRLFLHRSKRCEQLAGPPEQSGTCRSVHLRRGGGWQTSFPGLPHVLAGLEASSVCTVTIHTQAARYVNFSSVHPASHKRAVINTLLQCATRLCSKPKDAAVDTAKVRDDLSNCGYPRHFISAMERQLARRGQVDAPPHLDEAGSGASECLACVLQEYDMEVAQVPAKKMRNQLMSRGPKKCFPGVV